MSGLAYLNRAAVNVTRHGLRQVMALELGRKVGQAVRHDGSLGLKAAPGPRYAMDCPLCDGPLVEAPQCCGRAATDADPYRPYWYEPMPATHFAVACRSCEVAFFPLRDS